MRGQPTASADEEPHDEHQSTRALRGLHRRGTPLRVAEELDADPGDVTMYLNEGSSGGDSTTISGNAFADASGLRAYLCYVVRDAGRWVVKDFDLGARQ